MAMGVSKSYLSKRCDTMRSYLMWSSAICCSTLYRDLSLSTATQCVAKSSGLLLRVLVPSVPLRPNVVHSSALQSFPTTKGGD